MTDGRTSTERLVAFSDGVFSVIITIMVLELKPPSEAKLSALLPLWSTALSYAVSYLFVAIIWINHHRLLFFAHEATPLLIWWNFAHLFMTSLIPFSTAWIADTKLAARACRCIRGGICDGQRRVSGISAGGVVSSKYKRGIGNDPAFYPGAGAYNAGDLRCRRLRRVLASSIRLRSGLLCAAHLSAAASSG